MILIYLPQLAEDFFRLGIVDCRHSPIQAEQRRAAQGGCISRHVAAIHQPAVGLDHLDRVPRTDQISQPVEGVGVVLKPGNLPAANGGRTRLALRLDRQQGSPRLVWHVRFQPAGGHRQRQRRLETGGSVGRVVQPSQGERAGQRRAVVDVV